MSVNKKMTAIADAIREKTGNTEPLTLDDMAIDISKVYDAGKKSQYDEFWDSLQNNGKRTNYWGGFAGWTQDTFKPKYPLNNVNNCNYMFMYSSIKRISRIDFIGTTIPQAYAHSYSIETIECMGIKKDGSQSFTDTFASCTNLINLTIDGTIGQNGFNVKQSTKLSHDSLMSIINALADYSEDTSGTSWVVTLGTTNLAKLTDNEKAIATEKGWTLA